MPCPSLCHGITEFPDTRLLFPALAYAVESLSSLLLAFYSLPFPLLRSHSIPCHSTSIPFPPVCCVILSSLVLRLCSILFPQAAPCNSDSTPFLLTLVRNPCAEPMCGTLEINQTLFPIPQSAEGVPLFPVTPAHCPSLCW